MLGFSFSSSLNTKTQYLKISSLYAKIPLDSNFLSEKIRQFMDDFQTLWQHWIGYVFLFSKWKMNLTSLGSWADFFIRYFLVVQFYGFPLTFKLQKKVGKRAQHGYKLALKQKDFLLALINGKPYIFLLRRFDGFGISSRSWAKARSIVNFRTSGPSPYCNT